MFNTDQMRMQIRNHLLFVFFHVFTAYKVRDKFPTGKSKFKLRMHQKKRCLDFELVSHFHSLNLSTSFDSRERIFHAKNVSRNNIQLQDQFLVLGFSPEFSLINQRCVMLA